MYSCVWRYTHIPYGLIYSKHNGDDAPQNWSIRLFRYRRDHEIKMPAISQLLQFNSSFHHRHPHERNKVSSTKICSLKVQCLLLLPSSPCRPTIPLSTTHILKALWRNILSIHFRRSLQLFRYNGISSKVMLVKSRKYVAMSIHEHTKCFFI